MEVPDWFVDHMKRTGEWVEPKVRPHKRRVRECDSGSRKDVLRAFTINPVAGWLILEGIKDVENRWIAPKVRKGIMAVTFSKIYARAKYLDDLEWARDFAGKKVAARIPAYEAFSEMRGKCVGVVDYEIKESTDSIWWEVEEWKPWCVSNPRWLQKPLAVCGQIGCWTMKPDDAKKVLTQL